jgi:hypothetical protein
VHRVVCNTVYIIFIQDICTNECVNKYYPCLSQITHSHIHIHTHARTHSRTRTRSHAAHSPHGQSRCSWYARIDTREISSIRISARDTVATVSRQPSARTHAHARIELYTQISTRTTTHESLFSCHASTLTAYYE